MCDVALSVVGFPLIICIEDPVNLFTFSLVTVVEKLRSFSNSADWYVWMPRTENKKSLKNFWKRFGSLSASGGPSAKTPRSQYILYKVSLSTSKS